MRGSDKLDITLGLILSIIIIAVLLTSLGWFYTLKDGLQQKYISTGMLDYGTMGEVLKQLGLIRFSENDYRRFKKTENTGDQIEEITFQKKRQVGDYLYIANTAGQIGYTSTEILQSIQPKDDWPIVSIAVNEKYLNDPDTGILVNRDKKGREWERLVEISYMEKGQVLFETYAGMRLHGGLYLDEKHHNYKPGFRLYFRGKYGLEAVPSDLILPHQKVPLRTLVFKTTTWLPQHPVNNPLAYDIASRIGCEVPSTRLIELYINGENYGLAYAVEHVSRRQWGQRFDHENYLLFVHKSNHSFEEEVGFLRNFFSVVNDPKKFSPRIVAEKIDLDSLFRQVISWAFCGTDDYCQGAAAIDLADPKAKGFLINWDMDQSFLYSPEKWQQQGFDRHFASDNWKNDCFQSRLFGLLLEESAQHRAQFLLLLVEVLNHRLTQEYLQTRVEYYKIMLEKYGEPHKKHFTLMKKFMKHRPGFLLQEIKKRLSLFGPFDCAVTIPEGRGVIIDGYTYSNSYRGKYFFDTPVQLTVQEKDSEHFKHWLINGEKKLKKSVGVQLFENTTINAVFSD